MTRRIAVREMLLLLVVLTGGLTARVWDIDNAGIDHFDEGVYAYSARGIAGLNDAPTLYLGQPQFSPPFYFTAAGILMRVFGGDADRVAILVSVLLGTLTIAAAWWVGRQWFGARAAMATAVLVAFSQYHITFARAALTDVSFTFLFVLAIGLLTLAFRRDSLAVAILAGLATGLAWNTKYHGWFVLVIGAGAIVPLLWRRKDTPSLGRSLVLLLTTAIVAGICYLPWMLYIRSYYGGYGAFASYYSTMLRADWVGNLWRQARMQFFMEGVLSRASVPMALAAAALVAPVPRALSRSALTAIAVTGLVALLLGSSGAALVLALFTLPALLRDFGSYHVRVLLCWLGLWVISAPVYHPYARLILPFTIAMMVAAGHWISRAIERTEGMAVMIRAPAWSVGAVATVIVAVASLAMPHTGNPWRPSRSAAAVADAIAETVPAGDPVLVLGEPELAYYIDRTGRPSIGETGIGVLDSLSTPAWVVTGVYTRRAPALRKGIAALGERLTPIERFAFRPKDVRLLDDMTPEVARAYLASPDTTFDLHLYRIMPAGATR